MSAGLRAATGTAALLDGWLPWLIAPFVATVAYVVLEGVNIVLAVEAEERSSR